MYGLNFGIHPEVPGDHIYSDNLYVGEYRDGDGDGINDNVDNCPDVANPNQVDVDNDEHGDVCDNCPETTNPRQQDVDGNEIGDMCDDYTIYGYVTTGDNVGVVIDLNNYTCGLGELLATITTSAEGYYAFAVLENDNYGVIPQSPNYTFRPGTAVIVVPQIIIRSYDFVATDLTCADVDRFLDNSDGTVTDCRTGLLWLKDDDCYGLQRWDPAMSSAAGLNDGECGLTDSSAEGDWRLPTKDELQGIGTDPPATWSTLTPPAGTWTIPGPPFALDLTNPTTWTGTEGSTTHAWAVMMSGPLLTRSFLKTGIYKVWPVSDSD